MNTYIDTSAVLALFDADDPRHEAAAAAWSKLMGGDEQVITSNYVVVETISLLHRRFGVSTANRFLADMLPSIGVEWIGEVVHAVAVSALLISGRRGPSLVDCVSFEIMRRMDIGTAFAYDKHFVDAGFEVL